MSKKAVIVPKHKWCVIQDYVEADFESHTNFVSFPTRDLARALESFGDIRKVTKIVYYYE